MEPTLSPAKRRLIDKFNVAVHCIYCAGEVRHWQKKAGQTVEIKGDGKSGASATIKGAILERNQICNSDDKWTVVVQSLVTASEHKVNHLIECHTDCNLCFRKGNQIPRKRQVDDSSKLPEKKKRERPINVDQDAAFQKAIKYLESKEKDSVTMQDLQDVMQNHLQAQLLAERSYVNKRVKLKLIAHHREKRVFFAEIDGKADVIALRQTVHEIVQQYHSAQPSGTEDRVA